MVDLEDAIIARYESHGESFEILIDPKAVKLMKEGKKVNLLDHLVIDTIFKNSRKGTRATDESMTKIFNTTDSIEIAKTIVLKGEIQLTTEQRHVMQEAKRKAIIEHITRNAINPQTGTPHPAVRIEAAMEEARVHVDPFKPVEVQIKAVLDALRPLLPIKFDTVRIATHLSGEDYGKCYVDILHFGKISKEEWQKDGSWIGVVEMPAGMQGEYLDRLNAKTRGDVQTKILK